MVSLVKTTKVIFSVSAYICSFTFVLSVDLVKNSEFCHKLLQNNHGTGPFACNSNVTRYSFLMTAQHLSKLHLFTSWEEIFCNMFHLITFKIIKFTRLFRTLKQPRFEVFEETFSKNNSPSFFFKHACLHNAIGFANIFFSFWLRLFLTLLIR